MFSPRKTSMPNGQRKETYSTLPIRIKHSKNHVTIDEEYKLIRGYGVTSAASHDSVPYLDVLPAKASYVDQEAFADSAYSSQDSS